MRKAIAALSLALLLRAAGGEAQNMVPDPAFVAGVSAWTPEAVGGNLSMVFAPNVSKRPGSGSALLSFTGQVFGGYSICLPVSPTNAYVYGYSYYFPDASRVAGFNETFTRFSGPGCTGTNLGGLVLPIYPLQIGSWLSLGTQVSFPPECRSVKIGFATLSAPGTQPLMYLDDVYFGLEGTIPPIDPPPDIPMLSVFGAAALAVALAFTGLRALRA
jgi:hypothetical protein